MNPWKRSDPTAATTFSGEIQGWDARDLAAGPCWLDPGSEGNALVAGASHQAWEQVQPRPHLSQPGPDEQAIKPTALMEFLLP